jgi:hypothetical protein
MHLPLLFISPSQFDYQSIIRCSIYGVRSLILRNDKYTDANCVEGAENVLKLGSGDSKDLGGYTIGNTGNIFDNMEALQNFVLPNIISHSDNSVKRSGASICIR